MTAAGVLGLIFTDAGFDTGETVSGENFLIFEVNGWHNVFHIATGVLLVLAAGTLATAATGAFLIGLAYIGAAVWLTIDGSNIASLIPVDTEDQVLHIGLGALLLTVGASAGALGIVGRESGRVVEAPAEPAPAAQAPATPRPTPQPPAGQPPAAQPPADQPPAAQPPADQPPADQPPAGQAPPPGGQEPPPAPRHPG